MSLGDSWLVPLWRRNRLCRSKGSARHLRGNFLCFESKWLFNTTARRQKQIVFVFVYLFCRSRAWFCASTTVHKRHCSTHWGDWQPDIDRVAMVGISYGAGLALLGADRDARIKAVVAMSGWTAFINALFKGSQVLTRKSSSPQGNTDETPEKHCWSEAIRWCTSEFMAFEVHQVVFGAPYLCWWAILFGTQKFDEVCLLYLWCLLMFVVCLCNSLPWSRLATLKVGKPMPLIDQAQESLKIDSGTLERKNMEGHLIISFFSEIKLHIAFSCFLKFIEFLLISVWCPVSLQNRCIIKCLRATSPASKSLLRSAVSTSRVWRPEDQREKQTK